MFVNAGGHRPELIVGPQQHFAETGTEALPAFYETNLFGPRECFRQMSILTREIQDFVGVASCSLAPIGLSRVLDYRIAKAGLEQMIQWLALDHGRKYGHRFIGLAPGFATDARSAGQQNAFATKDPVRFGAISNRIVDSRQYIDSAQGWATGAEIASALAPLFSHSLRYVNGTTLVVDGGFSINALGNEAI
jgi:NAD(P)-dependent dehydrogenase (short-subunit alcohol dehydrogenase family)